MCSCHPRPSFLSKKMCIRDRPNILVERYKLKEEEMADVDTILESIGRRRGCLVSGGVVDLDKARLIILQDYRKTKLGTITLDQVDEEPYYPEAVSYTHLDVYKRQL